MAYQVKRGRAVYEILELLDENDHVAHSLQICVDVDAVAKDANRKILALNQAQADMRAVQKEKDSGQEADLEKAQEALGRAVIALYETLMGKENTETILEFYQGRFLEMNMEITPFVLQVLVPRVRDAAKELQQRMAYQYNRKAIRKSGIFRRK